MSEVELAAPVFEFAFAVPGTPTPWARARQRQGRFFKTDEQYWAGEQVVAAFERARQGSDWPGKGPWSGPVGILIVVSLRRPGKWRSVPSVKPDWDNYGKLVSDALNRHAYDDDGQIVEGTVRKVYGNPGVGVVLRLYEQPPKPAKPAQRAA